jgi:PST family polysaccharide transporter
MVTIFAQTDKIMLKAMMTEEAVGIYSAAVTCAGLTSFVFSAIIDSVRPSILAGAKKEEKDYEGKVIFLFSVITYVSLAQCIVMTLFATPLIRLLYGPDFIDSAEVLRIGVWYTTFSYIGAVRSVWILAENKQKYMWILNSSGAVCNILLNICLIPNMGAIGAAIASLLSQFFTNIVVPQVIPSLRRSNSLFVKSLNPKYIFAYLSRNGR